MRRILVTGATGFLGAALVERLAGDGGFQVVATTRRPASLPDGGVTELRIPPLETSFDWDWMLGGVDSVVHLASNSGHDVATSGGDDLLRRVNVDGAVRLAQAARRLGVSRFLYLSTIGVLGLETQDRPFDEQSPPDPSSPYGATKLEAERRLREILAGSLTRLTIVRPPLVYGIPPRSNFGTLLRLVERGVPIPVSHRPNRRSWIARGNLVDFLVTCLIHPAAGDQLFVVSDGKMFSTAEIVRFVARGMARKPRLLVLPDALLRWGTTVIGKPELYRQLCGSLAVNPAKSREVLGWSPPIAAEDALVAASQEYLASKLASKVEA